MVRGLPICWLAPTVLVDIIRTFSAGIEVDLGVVRGRSRMSVGDGAQDATPRTPLVSIGMPTYNSAAWLEASINSILAQSFGDFEFIISDNASSDATMAICERHAGADARIRLLRQPENRGANENYLATLRAARGAYFKWASSNDICAPTFIERCLEALERDSTVVLAYPRSSLFDESVELAQPYDRDIELLANEPAERFMGLQNRMALNNAMNGLIRREALLRASILGNFLGADLILMTELSLLGKFQLLDDRLFFRRMSAGAATRYKTAREVEQHHVPSARAPLRWQRWRYHVALLRATRLVRFASRDWFRTVDYALRSFVWFRKELAAETLQSLRAPAAWESDR